MPNKTLEKWEEKTINDVCIVERGSSPRPIKDFITTDNNGVNWIKIGDCSGKYVTNTAQKITQEGAKKSRYVKVGDFIISNSMSYGKPYILKIDGYIHDGWFVLRLNNDLVNTDYFYYLLSSNYIREQYDALATGAIVQNISSDLIKKVTFKLPPLQDQQRIVGILDEAFENIEKAKQNALQNLNNAKELFESYLINTFLNNNETWLADTLQNICEKISAGGDKPEIFSETKTIECNIPIYSNGIKDNGLYGYTNNPTIEKPAITISARETIGFICKRLEPYCPIVRLISLIPKDFIDLSFLAYAMNFIIPKNTGTSIPQLTVPNLKTSKIQYPSLSEQQKIVAQLDELQEQTKKLEQIYEQKIKDLDELKQSILQKAFNGEL